MRTVPCSSAVAQLACAAASATPVPAKPGQPTDDGLWLNQNQRPFPTRPESLKQNPEHPVRSSHVRSGSFGRKNGELLPQGQILKKEIAAGKERIGDQCLQEPQQAWHAFIFTLKPIFQDGFKCLIQP
jgi:hypothetical protein